MSRFQCESASACQELAAVQEEMIIPLVLVALILYVAIWGFRKVMLPGFGGGS